MGNGGKKAFLSNPTLKYRVSHCEEHDCCSHKKKNVDYCDYPSLTHFMDEH